MVRVAALVGALRGHRAVPHLRRDDLQDLAAAQVLDRVQDLAPVLTRDEQPPPLMVPGGGEGLVDLGPVLEGLALDPIRSLLRTLAQETTEPDSGSPAIRADATFRTRWLP